MLSLNPYPSSNVTLTLILTQNTKHWPCNSVPTITVFFSPTKEKVSPKWSKTRITNTHTPSKQTSLHSFIVQINKYSVASLIYFLQYSLQSVILDRGVLLKTSKNQNIPGALSSCKTKSGFGRARSQVFVFGSSRWCENSMMQSDSMAPLLHVPTFMLSSRRGMF